MSTFFISDLHLSPTRLDILDGFKHTLAYFAASKADAVYILGDLFELWIGDDDHSAFHDIVIETIAELSAQSIPVFIMHGNRDFLLGDTFAKKCGANLIQDPSLITLYGKSVLLAHGDAQCTDDKAYQTFRTVMHQPWLQKLFLTLPLAWRKSIAKHLRSSSASHTQSKPKYIMDVNAAAVRELLEKANADTLIHGHTHYPAVHIQPEKQTRIVLSDWHDRINYLEADEHGTFRLRNQLLR